MVVFSQGHHLLPGPRTKHFTYSPCFQFCLLHFLLNLVARTNLYKAKAGHDSPVLKTLESFPLTWVRMWVRVVADSAFGIPSSVPQWLGLSPSPSFLRLLQPYWPADSMCSVGFLLRGFALSFSSAWKNHMTQPLTPSGSLFNVTSPLFNETFADHSI